MPYRSYLAAWLDAIYILRPLYASEVSILVILNEMNSELAIGEANTPTWYAHQILIFILT